MEDLKKGVNEWIKIIPKEFYNYNLSKFSKLTQSKMHFTVGYMLLKKIMLEIMK